eukprot:gene3166-3694_t
MSLRPEGWGLSHAESELSRDSDVTGSGSELEELADLENPVWGQNFSSLTELDDATARPSTSSIPHVRVLNQRPAVRARQTHTEHAAVRGQMHPPGTLPPEDIRDANLRVRQTMNAVLFGRAPPPVDHRLPAPATSAAHWSGPQLDQLSQLESRRGGRGAASDPLDAAVPLAEMVRSNKYLSYARASARRERAFMGASSSEDEADAKGEGDAELHRRKTPFKRTPQNNREMAHMISQEFDRQQRKKVKSLIYQVKKLMQTRHTSNKMVKAFQGARGVEGSDLPSGPKRVEEITEQDRALREQRVEQAKKFVSTLSRGEGMSDAEYQVLASQKKYLKDLRRQLRRGQGRTNTPPTGVKARTPSSKDCPEMSLEQHVGSMRAHRVNPDLTATPSDRRASRQRSVSPTNPSSPPADPGMHLNAPYAPETADLVRRPSAVPSPVTLIAPLVTEPPDFQISIASPASPANQPHTPLGRDSPLSDERGISSPPGSPGSPASPVAMSPARRRSSAADFSAGTSPHAMAVTRSRKESLGYGLRAGGGLGDTSMSRGEVRPPLSAPSPLIIPRAGHEYRLSLMWAWRQSMARPAEWGGDAGEASPVLHARQAAALSAEKRSLERQAVARESVKVESQVAKPTSPQPTVKPVTPLETGLTLAASRAYKGIALPGNLAGLSKHSKPAPLPGAQHGDPLPIDPEDYSTKREDCDDPKWPVKPHLIASYNDVPAPYHADAGRGHTLHVTPISQLHHQPLTPPPPAPPDTANLEGPGGIGELLGLST